ncbi:MAG: heavy-metal-associated domain-containing protein [Chloroflexota bacterium]|nr:heavy-metal-associated domain-containing protein [Chloroflexota bacterium]
MTTKTLRVPDISCEHCERTIRRALSRLDGVAAVEVDVPRKRVHVTYDEALIGLEELEDALLEEDYPVDSAI